MVRLPKRLLIPIRNSRILCLTPGTSQKTRSSSAVFWPMKPCTRICRIQQPRRRCYWPCKPSIYLEQLAKHSKLALADTELTRRNNTNALARFNSGRGAKLGLFESNHPNEQLLPGSVVAATNWFEQFQDLPGFEDTPRKSAAEKLPGKTRKARHCRAPGAELRQGDPGLH